MNTALHKDAMESLTAIPGGIALIVILAFLAAACGAPEPPASGAGQEAARPQSIEAPKTDSANPDPVAAPVTSAPMEGMAPEQPVAPAEEGFGIFAHRAMGTEFEIRIAITPETSEFTAQAAAQEAFATIDDLESRISNWRPDSQATYMNKHAAKEPVRVAPDIFELLAFSEAVYRDTNGAFDPTVGPLIELWGFYKGEGRLPSQPELDAALEKVGYDKVALDAPELTVSYLQPGVHLDFGGIAKGLALDQAARVLRDAGIGSALISGGTSSLLAIGVPPGEDGWTVAIKNPYNQGVGVDEILLKDGSLSTSGSYEKFFRIEGREYCHIFDPKTGQPVEGMLSATALAPTGMESDALSTAFFVMGEERTREYCGIHPDIRAILVPMPERGEPKAVRINFDGGKEVQ